MSTKLCTQCGETKPNTEFYKRKDTATGLCPECKACSLKKSNAYYERNREKCKANAKAYYSTHKEQQGRNRNVWSKTKGWAQTLAHHAKKRALSKGFDFNIDKAFVEGLYEAQSGRCYWLDVELTFSKEKRNPLQPSLDRLDCSKGYTRDNVVLTCQFANMGRSDIEPDRFRVFVEHLKQALSNQSEKSAA